MAWRIEFDDKAKKDLAALDKTVAKRITAFLRERVSGLDDPRSIGEALKGSKLGAFWVFPACAGMNRMGARVSQSRSMRADRRSAAACT